MIVQTSPASPAATLRNKHSRIGPVVAAALCLVTVGVLASACGKDTPTPQPAPVATETNIPMPTATATAVPSPSPTSLPTEAPTPTLPQQDGFKPPDPSAGVGDIFEALVKGNVFQLEVAHTSSQRSRGLMERTDLPEDAAMLFVYEREEYRNFWMKNTLIPLDILFLNALGIVVDVQTMQPQIGVSDGALKIYRSARPARFALEMNAGLAGLLGIVPGSQVLFR